MLLNRFKKAVLFLGDIVVLYAALFLTLIIRYRSLPRAEVWDENFMPFTVLFAVWLAIFYMNGLYEISASKNDIEFYNKIWHNLLINFGVAAGYFYLLTDKLFDIKPQTVFFIYMAVSSVLFVLWRYIYNGSVQSAAFRKNILVIGMKDEARELIEEIIKKPQLGYRVTSIIHSKGRTAGEFPGVKMHDKSVDIKQLLKAENISTIVTALDPRSDPELIRDLFESLTLKIQFFDLATFYEKLTGKIPVTHIGHIWFLENLAESEKGAYENLKRGFEIVASLLMLLIFLPLLPLFALLIKLDSRGPVFFRQNRVGLLGREFSAIKFRSMIHGAEKEGEARWAIKSDPRVTRIGRIMRATRLDEIPQFLNVLRGDMSLIGPRPERPELVSDLSRDIPFYNERHLVKPGITGWAQINFQYGASTGDAFKKLQYDLFYIKNRSIPLDLGIALKTINIMLSGKGF